MKIFKGILIGLLAVASLGAVGLLLYSNIANVPMKDIFKKKDKQEKIETIYTIAEDAESTEGSYIVDIDEKLFASIEKKEQFVLIVDEEEVEMLLVAEEELEEGMVAFTNTGSTEGCDYAVIKTDKDFFVLSCTAGHTFDFSKVVAK